MSSFGALLLLGILLALLLAIAANERRRRALEDSTTGHVKPEQLRPGDVLFMDWRRSPHCVIEAYDRFPYIHVGVVVEHLSDQRDVLVADILADAHVQVRSLRMLFENDADLTCAALCVRRGSGSGPGGEGRPRVPSQFQVSHLADRVFEPSGAHVIWSWAKSDRPTDSRRMFCSEFVTRVLLDNVPGLHLSNSMPSPGELYAQLVYDPPHWYSPSLSLVERPVKELPPT